MQQRCIHQFSPATAPGDGVTGGLFFTQQLLRSLGYSSEIYSIGIPQVLRDRVLPIEAFDDEACDLLLFHHSMGHEHERWMMGVCCPKVMVYHNITPSHYFSEGSTEYIYSIKGRKQLHSWANRFVGGIGDSPLNTSELIEAGYCNTETLPMLVDINRFDGEETQPSPDWLTVGRPLLLFVGRIAENKRQHLLIDALWHLKQIWVEGALPRLLLVGGVTSPAYRQALLAHIERLGLEDDVVVTGKCSDEELRWLYRHANVFWCASEHEGFGMPLIEAGYFGLPVISFNSSNIAATLGESGLVIEPSDPLSMAVTTLELLNNEELRVHLGSASRRNLERYRAEVLLPQLQTYLSGLGLESSRVDVTAVR